MIQKATFMQILAILVITGGGFMLVIGDEAMRMGVSNMMTAVLSYYYGTSASSAKKDDAIANMSRRSD